MRWPKAKERFRLANYRCKRCGTRRRYVSSNACVRCSLSRTSAWFQENMLYARCRKYGMTVEEFHLLLQEQRERCAICRKKLPAGTDSIALVIDHDHRIDRPRGLLCRRCNLGLGHFLDSRETLLRAIEYLKRWAKRRRQKC